MSKAWGALSLLVVLVAGLVFTPSARADSQARIVRLSLVSGPVQIDRGDGFEKAIMNMPITQGMKLWTQGDSRAEVEFEDGATMRLTPEAKLDFEQLTLLSSGAKASTVKVNQGRVYFNVPKEGENDFRVAFDGQQLSLTHSVRFRLNLTSDQVEIAVFKGELALNGAKEIKVKKNETATLERSVDEKGSYQLAKGISVSPYDEWDTYRLQFNDQYASAGSKNVPYDYGRSDLNYYGSWGYVPGYGSLWRPFGFGYGWDPFDSGAWAWYPGWGYTWVSGYPWGWIPYRYGSWVWVQNYGWCWRPGGYSNWSVVPAVINPPPAFKPPQPPPVGPVAGAGGTGSVPHPPTIIVQQKDGIVPRGPRRIGDDLSGPVDSDHTRAVRTTTMAPAATSGTTASPATAAAPAAAPTPTAAQPPRSVRTFVPKSGPGMGPRPLPVDEVGVVRDRGDGARPVGLGMPPVPRARGSQPAAPRVSAPGSAPRSSAPSRSHSVAPSGSRSSAPVTNSAPSRSAPSSGTVKK